MARAERTDVVVVGAGAMGLAAARELVDRDHDVVVVEPHPSGHDRGGSHGATRLFRLVYGEPDYVRLAQEAQVAWRALEDATGTRLLETTGGVEHGFPGPALARRLEVLTAAGVSHEVIDAQEAARRWPGLRFAGPVLVQPDAGRLLAERALEALEASARGGGAEVRRGTAVHLVEAEDDGATVHLVDGSALHARQVVVAAGSWAPRLVPWLDLPPLRVTQEQPAHFVVRDGAADWPNFVHWRDEPGPFGAAEAYGLLAPGEGVKVGLHGTGPEVDPDRRAPWPEPAGMAALVDYVGRWYPGVVPEPVRPVSCPYDNTPTDDFVIDRSGPVTVATGFSGHGFKFVPVVGRVLADLVDGRPGPARFRLASHSSAEWRKGPR